MSRRQETIADIIAEMRGIRIREFQDYADRIEAAHRRERETADAKMAKQARQTMYDKAREGGNDANE